MINNEILAAGLYLGWHALEQFLPNKKHVIYGAQKLVIVLDYLIQFS